MGDHSLNVSQANASLIRNRPLLTLCLAVLVAYMGAGMVSTVRVLYVQHRGGSLVVISAMASAFLIANFVCQYPWGWLADRWGRKEVMLAGLLCQALLTVFYVFVTNPYVFIGLRFLEGAATASILPAARASIADMVPDESRGRAYGMFSAFFNLGFLFGPAAGGLLAAIAYSWVFVLATALRLGGAAIVFAGLRATRGSVAAASEALETSTLSWRPPINMGLAAAYIIAFGDYLWLGFDQTLAPLWMRHHLGASIALIGVAYSVWSLPSAIMAPFGGRLADRHRRWVLVLAAGLGQLPMYGLYILAHSIYPILVGFVMQACLYSIVSPAVDAHLAKASPRESRARAQSAFAATGAVGAFVGATVFVPLYALDYRLPLTVEAIVYGVVILVGAQMMRIWERRRVTAEQETYVVQEPPPLPISAAGP